MARFQGRLIEWYDAEGYGFIQGISDPRQHKLFLHINNFERSGPRPIAGCVVDYELGLDAKARPQAIKVRYVKAGQVERPTPTNRTRQPQSFRPIYLLMGCYWLSLVLLAYFQQLPSLSVLIIVLINGYCYRLYDLDKQAALRAKPRIAEQHLLLMSALGGWTGAWFAAQHFRHKTQKQPFNTYFALSIALNLALLCFSIWIFHLYQ
jgi:uncharacterized membrane protein YsdA (DUF1294 family)/cold shock CspA family protein